MKNHLLNPEDKLTSTGKIVRIVTSSLSDDAFYLIVLAQLLKKIVQPVSIRQFLATEDYTGVNGRSPY